MKYLGSKRKLIPFLEKTIKSVVGNDLANLTFCDLFAGTGIVGRHFKSSVKEIISNDLEYANDLIRRISGDVLYADPPYTGRQYGGDYHLLGTIARYDSFVPSGITGRREYKRSAWASNKTAEGQLDDLLKHAQFKYIFLSYNNEGLMPPDVIKGIMSKYGKYDVATTEYRRFKSSAGAD